MKLLYLLYTLFGCQPALALSIPHNNAQQPLRLDRQPTRLQSHAAGVILEFTQSGSNEEHRFEIPLRARVLSGTSMKTAGVLKLTVTQVLAYQAIRAQ